jgi:hypothetical protein
VPVASGALTDGAKELMARIGHSSARAALIYQHATAERDHAIASYLDDVARAAGKSSVARLVRLDASERRAVAGLDSLHDERRSAAHTG